MSSGCRLCSANVRALRDGGVLAVEAVAPPVERAREPALARPATLDDPDAAMAAGVLERAHAHVVGAQHDDRLIEDLVLDEVARLRDLLEPARHLPDPRPQQLGLHRVEVGVEVALLAEPGPGTPSRRAPGVPTTSDPRSPRRALPYEPRRYRSDRSVHGDRPMTRRRRRRRAGRRRRHHRHLPAVPRPRSRVLRAAARGRRRRRRHVVLEPLPRRPVRLRELHLRLPVLEGAVRRVGVAGALRRAAGDRALPQPRGRPVRPPAPHPVRRQGHRRRSTTSRRGRGPWRSATAPSSGRGSSSPRPACSRCRTSRTCRGATTSAASRTTPGCGRRRRSTSRASASPSSAPDRAACS